MICIICLPIQKYFVYLQKSDYLCSMKKIISTQGLSYGEFTDENLSVAIQERVCPRLEYCYYQFSGEEIHSVVSLSFIVMNREVRSLYLSFSIDNPTQEQLSNFRDVCNIFFNLDGFIANHEENLVSISANDYYDIGRLVHALEVMTVSLESILCVADEKDIDGGAIYSPNGFTIIQVPNVPKYRIKEGTTIMAPLALQNCPRLRWLDIPYGMIDFEEKLKLAPNVKYKQWTTLYDGTLPDEEDDDDDDDYILDEHHVAYSKDGKRLLFAKVEFNEPRYEVRDGVEEIDSFIFCGCKTYVVLSIPRSVRIIGDNLFGIEGGHIEIRDK